MNFVIFFFFIDKFPRLMINECILKLYCHSLNRQNAFLLTFKNISILSNCKKKKKKKHLMLTCFYRWNVYQSTRIYLRSTRMQNKAGWWMKKRQVDILFLFLLFFVVVGFLVGFFKIQNSYAWTIYCQLEVNKHKFFCCKLVTIGLPKTQIASYISKLAK